MIRVFRRTLRRFGLELKYAAQPVYLPESETKLCADLISSYTMLSNTRLVSLSDQVAYCNKAGLEGSFVECGVWKGGAVALMAQITKQTGRADRMLHLFDSFTDIFAPDPSVDGDKALKDTAGRGEFVPGQPRPMAGIYDAMGGHGTVEACREVIIGKAGYAEDRVQFHVGWFKDTVHSAALTMGPIALLRLDGDWYESTKVCLDALYDNVVSGGFAILDDYLIYDGCRKAVDEFIEGRNLKVFLTRVDTGCYFFVKP